MNPETFTSNLGALRNLESVFGLIFMRGTEALFSDAEFPSERITEIVSIVDDITYYFDSENRNPDQLSFGYDGANILIFLRKDLRMVVLYHNQDQVDTIADSARAFLMDYETSLLVAEFETVQIGMQREKKGVPPTEPIAPVR